uniref:Uncharacterized protein n=1 Tax=Cyprinus carpio carpio TaxID=630221 RepID=A0A9J8CPP7_CYPCA
MYQLFQQSQCLKTASLDTPKAAPKTAPKPSFLTAPKPAPFGFSKLCKPWEKELNPIQDKLLSYVLDMRRPGAEIIIKEGPTCLTREEFWSLGLQRDMDFQIGNACFKLIHEAAQQHEKDIEDMYVIPTWKCTPKNMAVNFPGLPRQTFGNDYRIFMLMYTLCIVTGVGFDFQEVS